ncbi:type II secretion system ATPase GspE [Massilia sp. YIM B02443]|jgi:general secretion pathway protein E|uniref:type II secretion system ATPase GspE n=1 Tax=Massilia sp. YIM B02443 TaxID=3050127 RepID=UPI0025B6F4F1|nr:type II secretion system ATPase GspE [Massilia sp. YIM B02443]MDN4037954.1 type II secretion system ATPase GspE [Massilia sp. YIM B02443]
MNNLLPYAFARDHGVLARGSGEPGQSVEVLVSGATAPAAIAEVSRRFGRIVLRRLERGELDDAIASAYAGGGGDASQVADEFDADLDLTKLLQDVPAIEDLLESSDDAPVIRMINALLTQSLREGASDIHIEPFEQTSVVRFRIDGALRDIVRPKKAIHASLISRIKIMSQLDIAEKRLPQDGRITLRVGGKPVDVRVSTLPTGHGERAVLRLLDKEAGRLDLSHLGMDPQMLPQFDRLINQPHGIVLVTGPTGSGKTTTLYAALSRLNAATTNIMTVEDPIEYDLNGVGQTQVNARIDMTFAKALRAILRQDPDVIMIGEIRDLETAQIAVQASLTGHLVLATLHTNDAASAVTRLLDMGIEPFLLSSSLLGVMAQRLVRKLCTQCKTFDGSTWHAVGCERCGHTGYHGRVGVYELLETTEEIRAQIHNQASEAEIRDTALKTGMKTMRDDGERWLLDGTTTRAELVRVTKD